MKGRLNKTKLIGSLTHCTEFHHMPKGFNFGYLARLLSISHYKSIRKPPIKVVSMLKLKQPSNSSKAWASSSMSVKSLQQAFLTSAKHANSSSQGTKNYEKSYSYTYICKLLWIRTHGDRYELGIQIIEIQV